MKRIALVIAIILAAQFAQAQTPETIKWMSFEEAIKQNAVKPKYILIDLYTDWCGWCKVMDRTTLADPVIVKYINENYYAVKFDAEGSAPVKFYGKVSYYDSTRAETIQKMDTITFQQQPSQMPNRKGTHQLAIALTDGKLSYPSYVILDSSIQRLDIIAGANDAAAFETMLNYFVSGSYKTMPFQDFEKTFKPTATAKIRSNTPAAPGTGGH